MGAGPASPYRGGMTEVRAGRAALNAVAGLLLGVAGLSMLAGAVIVIVAAVISLVTGPGDWVRGLIYAGAVLVVPVVALGASQGFAELHRARIRSLLRVDIPRPGRTRVRWWLSSALTRGYAYQLASLFLILPIYATVVGAYLSPLGMVVLYLEGRRSLLWWVAWGVSTVVMLILAPSLAASSADIDVAFARGLLGPSRTDELAEQVESLARSRAEIVEATDTERRRIERDLHDGAQQRLVSLAMNLGLARATLTDAPEPARRAIEEAHDEAVLALSEMRAFIRGLHPAVLNDRGLDAALSGLVAHSPVPVRLTVDVPERTSATVEAVAYFIVSEALTNVAKHANASRAEVTVTRTGDRLRVVVSDDGRGGAASTGEGTGLRGLAQRAASVDGTLDVHSPAGGPTTVTAELPCES